MSHQIGFLVFPDFQLIDLAGPFDLVALVSDCRLHLIWKDRLPVTSTSGWGLAPTTTLQDCPALDVLCIPGGSGVNALMQDAEILSFVRSQAVKAHYVTSVCTGALVLGAAGLLRGRRATTHWASHHLLAGLGAIPVQERIIADGPVITGGGATAGIDFALDIIARLAGRFEAEVAQLELEYAPAPPLNAGTPRTAPEAVVARVRADSAQSVAERERIVADLALVSI
jgi:cyclohexyl-isocyanide hydratase